MVLLDMETSVMGHMSAIYLIKETIMEMKDWRKAESRGVCAPQK